MKHLSISACIFCLICLAIPNTGAYAWTIIPSSSATQPQAGQRIGIAAPPPVNRANQLQRAAIVPNIPNITSPSSNQIFRNFPRQLRVAWDYDGAVKHSIEISCDYCQSVSAWSGAPTLYNVSNYTNNFSSIMLPGDNQYRVRVKAINASGQESNWSNYVYFNYNTKP